MAESMRQARVPPSDEQTAEYTYDMLMALKELAVKRGQETLALLLSAAADEARVIARSQRPDSGGPRGSKS